MKLQPGAGLRAQSPRWAEPVPGRRRYTRRAAATFLSLLGNVPRRGQRARSRELDGEQGLAGGPPSKGAPTPRRPKVPAALDLRTSTRTERSPSERAFLLPASELLDSDSRFPCSAWPRGWSSCRLQAHRRAATKGAQCPPSCRVRARALSTGAPRARGARSRDASPGRRELALPAAEARSALPGSGAAAGAGRRWLRPARQGGGPGGEERARRGAPHPGGPAPCPALRP